MRDNSNLYNDKDKVFENTENKINKEDYAFYSKKLGKVYDSVEALRDAERKEDEKKAAKELASSQRKADAEKVESAYKKISEALRVKRDGVDKARKDYLKKQAELKKEYEAQVKALDVAVDAAEDAYTEALEEFTKKHGDFHTTFKDGDATVSLHKSTSSFSDFWDDFLDTLFRF